VFAFKVQVIRSEVLRRHVEIADSVTRKQEDNDVCVCVCVSERESERE